MPRGAVPGWAPRGPVEGNTPEERARFECERQGIPFEPSADVMGRIAQIIARHHEAKARSARLDRGAA